MPRRSRAARRTCSTSASAPTTISATGVGEVRSRRCSADVVLDHASPRCRARRRRGMRGWLAAPGSAATKSRCTGLGERRCRAARGSPPPSLQERGVERGEQRGRGTRRGGRDAAATLAASRDGSAARLPTTTPAPAVRRRRWRAAGAWTPSTKTSRDRRFGEREALDVGGRTAAAPSARLERLLARAAEMPVNRQASSCDVGSQRSERSTARRAIALQPRPACELRERRRQRRLAGQQRCRAAAGRRCCRRSRTRSRCGRRGIGLRRPRSPS